MLTDRGRGPHRWDALLCAERTAAMAV